MKTVPMTAEDQAIWMYQEGMCGRLMFQAADRADASIMSRTSAIHAAMRNPGEIQDWDAPFNHNLIR